MDMDGTSESPPAKPRLHNPNPDPEPDVIRDMVMWKRKPLNVLILAIATATWILIDVYHYNLVTLLSWVAMAVAACLFFWGNIHRFLKKEAPDLSEMEIGEETAMKAARYSLRRAEDAIRLMFHVSMEREWFVFGGAVVCLFLISEVARRVDFLTLCYLGVIGVMIIPVIYVNNKERIHELEDKLRVKSQRLYSMGEEKLQNVKNKVAGKQLEIKEKKTE